MRQLCYFIMLFLVCQELFSFFFWKKRRRRDLNPRAAINDLLPFQGSPFGQLGYFSKRPRFVICISQITVSHLRALYQVLTFLSKSLVHYIALSIYLSSTFFKFFQLLWTWLAERVGFEPTRPCGQTVFKTASLWPLRYLSICCCLSLVFSHRRRKWYSSTKVFTCQQLFYIFFIFSFSDFNKPWNPA